MGIHESITIDPRTRYQRIRTEYILDVVDGNKSGLVSSGLQNRLELLESLKSQVSHFKLLDNPRAYYYLLTSCSHIQITPTPGNINIEVNVANVIRHLLTRITCRGDKGDIGDEGTAGRDGVPHSGIEPILVPTLDENNLKLETYITRPLETSTSLRLYADNVLIAEVDFIDGSYIVRSGIIEIVSWSLSDTFSAVIKKPEVTGNITYRIRQRGPTGQDGLDGRDFLVIDEYLLDTESRQYVTYAFSIKSDFRYSIVDMDVQRPIVSAGLRPNKSTDDDSSIPSKFISVNTEGTATIWDVSVPDVDQTILDVPIWPIVNAITPLSRWFDNTPYNIMVSDSELKCCREDLFLHSSVFTPVSPAD